MSKLSEPERAGRLWKLAQHSSIGWRRFLVLMAAGGAAAVLAACTDVGAPGEARPVEEPDAVASRWFKDPALFNQPLPHPIKAG